MTDNTATAIRIRNLSKCYHIYKSPQDRLKQSIMPRLQRLLGKRPTKYYQEHWALSDVSLEIKKGETIGIVGPNGSGKSTLLQMICGTLNPTTGTIEISGRIAALLELGSGFNPEFTGRENVYMNAAILGLNKSDVDSRFDKIAEFADIGQFIDQPVKTYSSGMYVRLAFAVIAHVDADILVIDEALAVGDAFFTQKCMRFLRNFMRTGTILFVSHDTGAVVNLCNKAVLLKNGHTSEIGAPKDVIEHYLATLYEETQDIDSIRSFTTSIHLTDDRDQTEDRDMREQFINASNLRNDIELFRFNPDETGFGTGDAKIVSLRLLDQRQNPLSWIVGGENVILEIQTAANEHINSPIVGFQLTDRLGQVIFADNTYLTYQHSPIPIAPGRMLITRFEFRMPVLPVGDYSISAAIADGTQDKHVQLHWKNDALIFKAHSSSVCFGLIGVPMRTITMAVR